MMCRLQVTRTAYTAETAEFITGFSVIRVAQLFVCVYIVSCGQLFVHS